MIAKFDTGGAGAGAGTATKSGSNTLLWVVVIGAALVAGYHFVVKPYMAKQKEKEAKAKATE